MTKKDQYYNIKREGVAKTAGSRVLGNSTRLFYLLTPESIMLHLDKLGINSTGRCLPLNALENRVYEIEVEGGQWGNFIVAKFYRPGRWTKDQLIEEHSFMRELEQEEIPVIAPLEIDGTSIFELNIHEQDYNENIYFSLYLKKGGRLDDDLSCERLRQLGYQLARLHQIGSKKTFTSRPVLNVQNYFEPGIENICEFEHLPAHLPSAFGSEAMKIAPLISQALEKYPVTRLHGDFHHGNVLWRDSQALIVDFDDCSRGPVVQDMWMMIKGLGDDYQSNREAFLEGYESYGIFDRKSLEIIPHLSILRQIHYHGWVAKRWQDPIFRDTFPQYKEESFWQTILHDLIRACMELEQLGNQSKYPEYF